MRRRHTALGRTRCGSKACNIAFFVNFLLMRKKVGIEIFIFGDILWKRRIVMKFYGNVVAPERAGYGFVEINNGKIVDVAIEKDIQHDEKWILPGFIDTHLHGLLEGAATAEKVHLMAEKAPSTGLVRFCPAMASDTHESMIDFIKRVRDIVKSPAKNSSLIVGSHLEGPYMEYVHKGGMNEKFIRMPDVGEMDKFIAAGEGTFKIMTISPELENADEVIKKAVQSNVIISAGHTGMSIEQAAHFGDIGGKAMCHICDTWDGRTVEGGVVQPSTMDAVLLDDRFFIEMISDGVHVPPLMVKMVIRMAGAKRVIGITDALLGAGDPHGVYPMTDAGRNFRYKDGVFRLIGFGEGIVGSCLTMNTAFFNLTNIFGFSAVESVWMTSSNSARYLGIDHFTGSLQKGLNADIVILKNDMKTVEKTILAGEVIYE